MPSADTSVGAGGHLADAGPLTHDAWRSAARHVIATHACCALLLIDIDRLECVNDTYGHLTGDHLLAVVDDLRERVAALTVATGTEGRTTRTTVSIGLTLTTSRADLTDALWRADTALYAAKAAGRNTVRSTGPRELRRTASQEASR